MDTQITKPQQPAETLATWRHCYEVEWQKAFKTIMFLMAEQYGMELEIELPSGETAASPTIKFWQESLKSLSPSQMREGLRAYMASEAGRFKPNPEEIRANAPGQPADKPRLRINPDCQECRGMGWVYVDPKHVNRCDCRVVAYQGVCYRDGTRRLPAAPSEELVKVPSVVIRGKGFPEAKPLNDAEYNARTQELERQRAELLKGKTT